MATNNFLPWGDNAGNIMDGADYEASTQRTDGVELGLADPALHNRLYRQVTLMAAALGQVIADNGLDASDSNMAGLVQAIKQVFAQWSGGTFTGNITAPKITSTGSVVSGSRTSETYADVRVERLDDGGNQRNLTVTIYGNGTGALDYYKNNSERVNGLNLTDTNTLLVKPLTVSSGGTGATDAAGARANLGVTPANIGALPTSGGTMGGDIEFGQTLHNVGWSYTDGRAWQVRPDPDLDLFQIVRRTTGGQYIGYLEVTKDGDLLIHNPLGVTEGGTGAGDALTAAVNLGLSDPDVLDISAADASDWTNQIRAHILERIQDRRCMVFSAGWKGQGYGSGLAWNCVGNTYVIIYNIRATASLKFWFYQADDQTWSDIGIG